MRKKLMKTISIFLSFLILFSFTACNKKISNKEFNDLVNKDEDGNYSFKKDDENEVLSHNISVRSENKMLNMVHKMANSIIIADKKWGEEEISKKKLNILIIETMKSNYKHKEDILDILKRWREGDFSKADKDHNLIWGYLGGTVGCAKGIDKDSLPSWAKEIK